MNIEDLQKVIVSDNQLIEDLQARLAAKEQELAEARKKQAINTNVRLFDLVRYMRRELHQANLIDDDEYASLCMSAMAISPDGGSPSPRRLEDYDKLRQQLTARDATIEGLRADLTLIFRWWDMNDGHLVTAYHPYVDRRMREIRARLAQLPPRPSAVPVHPDTARLDWLDNNRWLSLHTHQHVRAAIDAARQSTGEQGT